MDELTTFILGIICFLICSVVCWTSYNLAELSIKHTEKNIVTQIKDKP